ncbi:conserved hypothetical protein [Hyphomicrobiales bacterium]|nr:conserved hypothetical protein [Hyphomicrobiales bacterium]CAH1669673.1 hypothetical protein CHELA1G2_13144 [Hyphomicrobiales bacterium]
MANIDYKLVYEAKAPLDRLLQARRSAASAALAADEALVNWKKSVAKLCGCALDELQFSNVACLANGMIHHVYRGKGQQSVGKYVCVFCGCDDA